MYEQSGFHIGGIIMRKASQRKLSLLLVLFLVMPLVIGIAYADMGPKPSITIEVINCPVDNYYIALLRDDNSGGNWLDGLQNSDEVKNNAALSKIVNYNEGGWKMHVPPVGDSYHSSSSSGTYVFGYSVPKRFRVILVASNGNIFLSDPIEKVKFNAVFEYNAASGEIKEIYSRGVLNYVKNFFCCYVLTLAIEGITLVVFGLSTKKNRIHFLIINTVTQLLLNAVLIYRDWTGGIRGTDFWFTYLLAEDFWLTYLLAEVLILAIETGYYVITLRKKDGTKSPARSALYALTANLLSLFIGYVYYVITF